MPVDAAVYGNASASPLALLLSVDSTCLSPTSSVEPPGATVGTSVAVGEAAGMAVLVGVGDAIMAVAVGVAVAGWGAPPVSSTVRSMLVTAVWASVINSRVLVPATRSTRT